MINRWQVQLRDLTMGPGTDYEVLEDFNPFNATVRADKSGPRAWNHGDWSGVEWNRREAVPIPLYISASDSATVEDRLARLRKAFTAVGETAADVEMRFRFDGREYLTFVRPRRLEPGLSLMYDGQVVARGVVQPLDPRIYSADESVSGEVPLPTQTGGLAIRGNAGGVTVPFTVQGRTVGGEIQMTNEGTADASARFRIHGPALEPSIVLVRPDGTSQSVRYPKMLRANEWLDIDSEQRTALLNGEPFASVRGNTIWDLDPYPLVEGTTLARFRAADVNDEATLQAWWRSAWW